MPPRLLCLLCLLSPSCPWWTSSRPHTRSGSCCVSSRWPTRATTPWEKYPPPSLWVSQPHSVPLMSLQCLPKPCGGVCVLCFILCLTLPAEVSTHLLHLQTCTVFQHSDTDFHKKKENHDSFVGGKYKTLAQKKNHLLLHSPPSTFTACLSLSLSPSSPGSDGPTDFCEFWCEDSLSLPLRAVSHVWPEVRMNYFSLLLNTHTHNTQHQVNTHTHTLPLLVPWFFTLLYYLAVGGWWRDYCGSEKASNCEQTCECEYTGSQMKSL